MSELTIKRSVGDKKELVVDNPLRDFIQFFTQYPALMFILLGTLFAFIGERLLLDTHHVEVRCSPKKKEIKTWKQ